MSTALVQSVSTALVAVAPGLGFAAIFHDLGVQAVVAGGQTMNPSVAELAAAIRRAGARRVLLLPNNRNILLAAQQAAELIMAEGSVEVAVVRTTSAPLGIAALLAFTPSTPSLADLGAAMEASAARVATGEITRAVRAVQIDGRAVAVGELIGLHEGGIVVHGRDLGELLLDLLATLGAADAEIITLYRGEPVSEGEAENLVESVRARYPEQDVELALGGQPHYHFIVSVE
jgi:dihydroxyacetone kinase-like predicted kinase